MIKLTKVLSKCLFLLVFCYGTLADQAPPKQVEIKISSQAHSLIHRFEGFSATAYPDINTGAAPWTYGYGFTTKADGTPVQQNDRITKAEARRRIIKEAQRTCGAVYDAVPRHHVTQNRLDAAVSFCWNIGVPNTLKSVFLRRWIRGDINGAASSMMSWVSSGTNAERGLRIRRHVESSLFRAKAPILMSNY